MMAYRVGVRQRSSRTFFVAFQSDTILGAATKAHGKCEAYRHIHKEQGTNHMLVCEEVVVDK
jgi:hypothetical protein